jgi:dsRNA-specific ribonuclease
MFIRYCKKKTKGFYRTAIFDCVAPILDTASDNIRLSEFLILGKGVEIRGGRKKKNILADAMEALIGAGYLDGGYKKADVFVQHLLDGIIKNALDGQLQYDYKTMLQEYVQSRNMGELSYELVKISGPEHAQVFTSRFASTIGFSPGQKDRNGMQSRTKCGGIRVCVSGK